MVVVRIGFTGPGFAAIISASAPRSVHIDLFFGLLFVSGPDFEPDGGPDEAEGGANLVGEEALEAEVELDVLVGEEYEGGRRDGNRARYHMGRRKRPKIAEISPKHLRKQANSIRIQLLFD
jgi:hypothetical protein